jgi:hypothetical protein
MSSSHIFITTLIYTEFTDILTDNTIQLHIHVGFKGMPYATAIEMGKCLKIYIGRLFPKAELYPCETFAFSVSKLYFAIPQI